MLTTLAIVYDKDTQSWSYVTKSRPPEYSEPRILYGGPYGQDFTGHLVYVKPKTSHMVYKYNATLENDYDTLVTSYYNAAGHFQPLTSYTGPVREGGVPVWFWSDMSIQDVIELWHARGSGKAVHPLLKPAWVPGENCLFV